MKNIQAVESMLTRMAELLRIGSREDWALALEGLVGESPVDASAIAPVVLPMYGGMGSLNDLVLYKDGQPLAEENIEFDALRTELYQLLQGLRGQSLTFQP